MEYLYNLGKISIALDPFDPDENDERGWQMNEIAKLYATRSIVKLRRPPIRECVEDIAIAAMLRAYKPSDYFSDGLVGTVAKELFAPQRRPDYDRFIQTPQVHGYEALTAGYCADAHSNGAFYARFVLKMADPFWLLCPDVSHDEVMRRTKYLELYSNGEAGNSKYLCYWFDKSLLPASVLLFDKVLSGSVDRSGKTAALATLIEDVNNRIETSMREIDHARQKQKPEEVRSLERELAKKLFEITILWGGDKKNSEALSTLHKSGSKHDFQHEGKDKFLAFERCVSRAVSDVISHSKQWKSVHPKRSLGDCVGSFYDFESRVSAIENSAASDIQDWINCIPDTHELTRTYWYVGAPPGRIRKTKEDLRNDISSVIEGVDTARDDSNEHNQIQEALPDDIAIGQSLDVEKLILASLEIEAERHPNLGWDNHIPIFELILDQWKRGPGYGPRRSKIGRDILERLGGISAFREVTGVPLSSGFRKADIGEDVGSVLHDWKSYIVQITGGEKMKDSHSGRYLDNCVRYEMPGYRSTDGDSWTLKGGPDDRILIILESAIQLLNDGLIDSTLTEQVKRLVRDEYIPTALYAVYAERLATDHYQNRLATRDSSRNLHKRLSQWAKKLYGVNILELVKGYEPDLLSVQLNDNASSLFFPEAIYSLIKCIGNKDRRHVAPAVTPVQRAIRYMEIPHTALEFMPRAAALLRTLMIRDGMKDYSTIKRDKKKIQLFDVRDIPTHALGADSNECEKNAQTAVICLWGIVAMVEEVFGLTPEGIIL